MTENLLSDGAEQRQDTVRFYRGLTVALVAAMVLRIATEGTVLKMVLGAPLVEELFKVAFFLVLVAVVRRVGGLEGGWRRELSLALYYAVAVGVLTAGMEFFTSYYGEPHLHRFLRFTAHPTYLLVSLTTALWLWHPGRRWGLAWGVAAASAVHGLFNGAEFIGLVGASQGLVVVAALAAVGPAIYRMSGWSRGPRAWENLTTFPPGRATGPREVSGAS